MSKLVSKNIYILVIANLEHASPRIPGLHQYMCDVNDTVRVITPIQSDNFREKWGFDILSEKNFQIIEAPYSGDLLQIFRKLLWRLGFSQKLSLTEQFKSNLNSKKSMKFWKKFQKKIPEWLFRKFQEFFAIPDLEITWYKTALKVANIEIKKNDLILLLAHLHS